MNSSSLQGLSAWHQQFFNYDKKNDNGSLDNIEVKLSFSRMRNVCFSIFSDIFLASWSLIASLSSNNSNDALTPRRAITIIISRENHLTSRNRTKEEEGEESSFAVVCNWKIPINNLFAIIWSLVLNQNEINTHVIVWLLSCSFNVHSSKYFNLLFSFFTERCRISNERGGEWVNEYCYHDICMCPFFRLITTIEIYSFFFC